MYQHQIIEIAFFPSTFLYPQLTTAPYITHTLIEKKLYSKLHWESTPYSVQGAKRKPVVQDNLRTREPIPQKHVETDKNRWKLTTGAVGPTPARLTLTGVWSNAATVDTFISTVGCQRENQSNKESWHKKKKKPTTQLFHIPVSSIT